MIITVSTIFSAGFPIHGTNNIFQSNQFYFEMGIGFHQPQAQYTKYVDSGLSIRCVVSLKDADFPFIRYDGEFQYLGFKNDIHWENLSNYGVLGPSVRVKNSEQSLGFLVGPRLMSPTRKGSIRPYIGAKGGLFVFFETITWEWDNGLWHWFDDDDEDDSYTDVIDSEFHLGWILEMGTNVMTESGFGLDFGIQYTVIPGITRPQASIHNETNMILNDISRKLNADYVSFYIGVSLRNQNSH